MLLIYPKGNGAYFSVINPFSKNYITIVGFFFFILVKDVNYKLKTHCIPVFLLEYSKNKIFTIGSNWELQTLKRTYNSKIT